MKSRFLIPLVLLALVVGFGMCGVSSYNKLVTLDQGVQSQWAQVENVYQRRADLIPNLIETVKGAANFEKETLLAVTQARAKVGQVATGGAPATAESFQKYQQAQDGLTGAVSRLLVVAEAYPQLTATQGFRDLQAQLEGTENRITVERMRFNEAAQAFNSTRNRFPTVILAGFFGDHLASKQYFHSQAGTDQPPKVKF
jgi:LemA protein